MVEAQQSIVSVDGHADRVESDLACGWAVGASLAEPRHGETPQAHPLPGPQPLQGTLDHWRPSAAGRARGLDLYEYERPPVEGDQVDLAVASAHVARQDGEAQAGEVLRR